MYVTNGLGQISFSGFTQKLQAVGQMAAAIIQKAQGDPLAQERFDQAQTNLRTVAPSKDEAAKLFVAGAKKAARTIEVNRQTERLVAETMAHGGVVAEGRYAQAVPTQAGFFGDLDPLKLVLFAGVGFMLFSLATAKPKTRRATARRRPPRPPRRR